MQKNHLTTTIRVYFLTFSSGSIALSYHYSATLSYCSFVVSFEIRKCESSNFVFYALFFFFNLFQDGFGYSGCLFLLKAYLFNFWLRWVFVAASGLSLVAVSGGYSSLQCVGFLLWRLLLWRMSSGWTGFSSCSAWAQ